MQTIIVSHIRNIESTNNCSTLGKIESGSSRCLFLILEPALIVSPLDGSYLFFLISHPPLEYGCSWVPSWICHQHLNSTSKSNLQMRWKIRHNILINTWRFRKNYLLVSLNKIEEVNQTTIAGSKPHKSFKILEQPQERKKFGSITHDQGYTHIVNCWESQQLSFHKENQMQQRNLRAHQHKVEEKLEVKNYRRRYE